MLAVGHPPQRRQRFALASGRDRDDLLVRVVLDLPGLDQQPVGGVRDPEVRGDVEVLPHRTADEGDLATELVGGVDDLLDAMDVRGEAGDDDPPVRPRERLQQRGPDARLRRRDSRPVGVRRVAAEAQQALGAERRQAGEVGGVAVDRRLVELVIAGQQDRAELRVDRHRTRVRDRMRHVDHLDPEVPGLLDRARLQVAQGHVAQLVLLQLRADHADRQPAAVDRRWDADLAKHVRQGADVILVTVREDDRVDVVDSVAKVVEVRQDEVDAEHLGRREHQPRVDDHDAAAVFDDRHVLADLAEPAERQDAELAAAHATTSRPSWTRASRTTAR